MSTIMLAAAVWVTNVCDSIADRFMSERGQGIMEYSILVGGIALVAASVFLFAGGGLNFTGMRDGIQNCINFSPSC